jgi:hypothetical protein
MNKSDQHEKSEGVPSIIKLKKLKPQQVQKIDEYLEALGEYGEIRLVVQNGELRYINALVSHTVKEKNINK